MTEFNPEKYNQNTYDQLYEKLEKKSAFHRLAVNKEGELYNKWSLFGWAGVRQKEKEKVIKAVEKFIAYGKSMGWKEDYYETPIVERICPLRFKEKLSNYIPRKMKIVLEIEKIVQKMGFKKTEFGNIPINEVQKANERIKSLLSVQGSYSINTDSKSKLPYVIFKIPSREVDVLQENLKKNSGNCIQLDWKQTKEKDKMTHVTLTFEQSALLLGRPVEGDAAEAQKIATLLNEVGREQPDDV